MNHLLAIRRSLVAALWFLLALAGCGPGSGNPIPDSCSEASAGAVSAIELGGQSLPHFYELEDGDALPLIFGSQGGQMIGVRLRLVGDAPPSCFDQRTTVTDRHGRVLASMDVPLATYGEADGSRTTQTLWLPFGDLVPAIRDNLTVTVETSLATVERTVVVVDEIWPFGEAVDGPQLITGGTGVVRVALAGLNRPEMAVRFASDDPELVRVPESALMANDATELYFRIAAGAAETETEVHILSPQGEQSFAVSVLDIAGAPWWEVQLSEVLVEPEGALGDSNCDGLVDGGDRFVEIKNTAAGAADLAGVRLVDSSGVELFQFADQTLGPGEVAVVFDSPIGTSNSGPWCAGVSEDHIGDAILVTSSPMPAMGDKLLLELPEGSMHSAPTSESRAGESLEWVELLEEFQPHFDVEDSADDRAATPGTGPDGRVQVIASPL